MVDRGEMDAVHRPVTGPWRRLKACAGPQLPRLQVRASMKPLSIFSQTVALGLICRRSSSWTEWIRNGRGRTFCKSDPRLARTLRGDIGIARHRRPAPQPQRAPTATSAADPTRRWKSRCGICSATGWMSTSRPGGSWLHSFPSRHARLPLPEALHWSGGAVTA